ARGFCSCRLSHRILPLPPRKPTGHSRYHRQHDCGCQPEQCPPRDQPRLLGLALRRCRHLSLRLLARRTVRLGLAHKPLALFELALTLVLLLGLPTLARLDEIEV